VFVKVAHGSRHRQAELITDAQTGTSADLKSRQIRYVITMGFRVACFVAMIWVPSPYRWILLGAAVVLPYIAVIFANQADQRHDRGEFDRGGPIDAPQIDSWTIRQLEAPPEHRHDDRQDDQQDDQQDDVQDDVKDRHG
jgi:hypothetical protein